MVASRPYLATFRTEYTIVDARGIRFCGGLVSNVYEFLICNCESTIIEV